LEQGELPNIAMVAEGTILETIVTTRDTLRSELMYSSLKISRLEHDITLVDYKSYLYEASVPTHPHNKRWLLNTAVAGVLGFMLSVAVVFICPTGADKTTFLGERDTRLSP
jgi:hypothetical protein